MTKIRTIARPFMAGTLQESDEADSHLAERSAFRDSARRFIAGTANLCHEFVKRL